MHAIRALVAAGVLLSGGAEAATLKFGSFEPALTPAARLNYIPWFRAVEKDAGGALVFQEFWGGQLSRAPDKQFELMMNGMQDMTVTLPSYTQARFPEFSLFELPFSFRGASEAAAAEWRMYEQGLLSGLDRLKVVALYANGNSVLNLGRKIARIDDVKGLKIRTAGPEEAELIATLGAAPVAMAISQVAESLNRGVIDGTLNGWASNEAFKITPLLKSHYDAPFGVRSFIFAIRKEAYDALPEVARRSIDKHSGFETGRAFGAAFDREGAVSRDGAAKDPTRSLIAAEGAELEALRRRFLPQHERWIQTHDDGKRKYEALQKILVELRS
jgi:TRAP-type C4-dicarboxylate transport system substrate-binding protein